MFPNVIQAGDPTYNVIQFEWFLTNWCNFKCSYCSESGNMVERFSKDTSAGKYKLVLSRLRGLSNPFNVELIGGEPTLHPNIEDIIVELSGIDACQRIQVVTNLSRSLEFYKRFDHPKVQLIASYHPEHHTEDFVEKAAQIRNINVTVNLIDDPSYFDQTIKVVEMFKERRVEFAFNLLNDTPTYQPNYNERFFDVYDSLISEGKNNEHIPYAFEDGSVGTFNESQIVKNGLHKLKGYMCTPIRYRITHDGDIRNFCTGRKLPLIIGESTHQREVCPNECCGCDALFIFHKERV